MILLIDDTRDLGCDVIARTPAAAKKCLSSSEWNEVYFDHDLGYGENGYDVMKWMFENEIYPNKISIVTSNPGGRKNMEDLLNDNGYVKENGIGFRRMNADDFNEKYEKYLEDGHYGLDIDDLDVVTYLDREFQKEIKFNKDFSFSQIKLKFGRARVYANSDKCFEWEDVINKILGVNNESK